LKTKSAAAFSDSGSAFALLSAIGVVNADGSVNKESDGWRELERGGGGDRLAFVNKHISTTTGGGRTAQLRAMNKGARAEDIAAAENLRSYVGKDKNGQTLSMLLAQAAPSVQYDAADASRRQAVADIGEGRGTAGEGEGPAAAAIPLAAAGALAAAAAAGAEEKPLEVELAAAIPLADAEVKRKPLTYDDDNKYDKIQLDEDSEYDVSTKKREKAIFDKLDRGMELKDEHERRFAVEKIKKNYEGGNDAERTRAIVDFAKTNKGQTSRDSLDIKPEDIQLLRRALGEVKSDSKLMTEVERQVKQTYSSAKAYEKYEKEENREGREKLNITKDDLDKYARIRSAIVKDKILSKIVRQKGAEERDRNPKAPTKKT
jgi:hypothetical protein